MTNGLRHFFLVLEAGFEIVSAVVLIKILSFPRLLKHYGLTADPAATNPEPVSAAMSETCMRLGQTIKIAAWYTPINATCLPRALGGVAMARRRGIPVSLLFGIDPVRGLKVEAHAWCQAGETVFVGADARGGMRPLLICKTTC